MLTKNHTLKMLLLKNVINQCLIYLKFNTLHRSLVTNITTKFIYFFNSLQLMLNILRDFAKWINILKYESNNKIINKLMHLISHFEKLHHTS